jgi:hypothetical protein
MDESSLLDETANSMVTETVNMETLDLRTYKLECALKEVVGVVENMRKQMGSGKQSSLMYS